MCVVTLILACCDVLDVMFQDELYSLFFVNNNWYLFLRLHQLLCDRLQIIAQQARRIAADECRYKKERKESTAIALRLKAPSRSLERSFVHVLCSPSAPTYISCRSVTEIYTELAISQKFHCPIPSNVLPEWQSCYL